MGCGGDIEKPSEANYGWQRTRAMASTKVDAALAFLATRMYKVQLSYIGRKA